MNNLLKLFTNLGSERFNIIRPGEYGKQVAFPAANTSLPGVVTKATKLFLGQERLVRSGRRQALAGRPWLLVLIWLLLGWGLIPTTQAQKFVWAKKLGGTKDDTGISMVVDGSGNVYTTGYFSGTADFDPGAGVFNLTSAGENDIFVSKLNAGGNFVWAKRLGGTNVEVGLSVVVDGSGNVYTTGYFFGTADFDPGPAVFNLTPAGGADIFVSKLDGAGNFVWAKRLGGTKDEQSLSVAVDGAGNVYTTGDFNGTADFDPGAGVFNLTSVGKEDIFVSKLNAGGNFVWAKRLGGTDSDYSSSLAVDGVGNVYTTGSFNGTADFDPGAGVFNLISAGWADIFVSKLDGAGNFVWAKRLGGTSYDYSSSLAVDGAGNVYITGDFQGTADFDPGAGVFNLTSAGWNDIFVSKFNGSGNFFWAKQFGGIDQDGSSSLAVDGLGNVYTTGSFNGTADFDPGPGVFNLTSAGNTDIFVNKLDAWGKFVWGRRFGNTGYDGGSELTVDGAGNVYTAGDFNGTVNFNPGPGIFILPSAGQKDIFVSKLSQPVPPILNTWVSSTTVSAGNTLTLSVTATGGTPPYSYTWAAPVGFTLSATNTSDVSASVGRGLSGVQTFTITVASSDDSSASTAEVRVIVNAPPAAPFSITGVTTVRCETVTASQRRVTFTPQYAGLDGSPVSFSVVNEIRPTTDRGPYTLSIYTDNPVITLKATQSGTAGEASFTYNWLAACGNGNARLGAEPETELTVRVLGNPVEHTVGVEVTGVEGATLSLSLTNMAGYVVGQHRTGQAHRTDRYDFDVLNQPAGILLLRVSTGSQTRTVRILKND